MMNLTTELNNFKAQFRSSQPEDIKSTMAKATQDLINSHLVEESLQVGDRFPEFTLPNAVGENVALKDLLQSGFTVISFYRGGWCPYCNLELRALQQALPEIKANGANLVAISPQTPDNSLSTQEKNELEFQVLSDRFNRLAKQLGIVFTLPETIKPIYQNFGIDLPAANGDNSFELPLPATYIVDPDGKIAYRFADADYTNRVEPQEIVTALANINQ